jgi:hypothetical protein
VPEGSPIPDTPAVGLATKLGAVVGALASLLAVLAPVLDGDQTPETLGGLGVAALAFYAVIRGRSDQAAAITVAKGAAVAAELGAHPLQTVPLQTTFVGSVESSGPAVGQNLSPAEYAARYPEPSTGVGVSERDEQALEDVAAEELAETGPDDPSAIPLDTGDPDVAFEDAPAVSRQPDGPGI